ncbi:MAG: hypothetical protein ACKOWJ_00660 [Micrococcales bacterium]
MKIEEFLEFETRLTDNLTQLADVIGLVFVGSAAAHFRLDEWSDHDFFVVTVEGAGEALRQDLSWLPDADQIALSPRETDHGLKVVYKSGHVLEFAVFNDSELELAGANDYLVTVDKSGTIHARMAAIAAKSAVASEKARLEIFDSKAQYELFLCQLLIGVGRARRGELAIAGEHVRSWAVGTLIHLVRHWRVVAEGTEKLTDNLAPLRRFEVQFPVFGAQIAEAQACLVEDCAKALLSIALTAGEGALNEKQVTQAEVVSRKLGW